MILYTMDTPLSVQSMASINPYFQFLSGSGWIWKSQIWYNMSVKVVNV